MLTVEEMERAFLFFKDIRTHSDYVHFNDLYRFYQLIDKSRPVSPRFRIDS